MIKLIFQMLKEKNVIKSNIEGKEIIIYDPNYFMQNIYPNIIIECQDKIKEFFSDFEEKEKYSYVRIKTDYKVLYDKISGFNNRFIEGDIWLEFYIDENLFNFNESIDSLIERLNVRIIIYNLETNRINSPKIIHYYFKRYMPDIESEKFLQFINKPNKIIKKNLLENTKIFKKIKHKIKKI